VELHHSAGSRYKEKLNKRLVLEPVPDLQSELLASWYSAALNSWGVQLQFYGRLPAAQHRFEQALALVTNNICAAVNFECNTNLQAAKRLTLAGANNLAAQLQDLDHLVRVMDQFGPIDQPAVCFLFGRECQMIGWPRQALQQLGRAVELAPMELPPRLAQAEIYSRYRQDDQVFALLKQIRAGLSILPTNEVGHVNMELDLLEAKSWMSQTNLTDARRILEAILEKNPDDLEAQNLVMNAYMNFGDLTNALQLVSRQLDAEPDNTELLNRQAGIFMELNQPTNALAILDHALAITNLPNLRLNHAHASLQSGDLANAEAEFRDLAAQPPDLFLVHFGLASIAELRHDTNLAIQHWEICFTNSPLGSARWLESRAHLAALKPGKTEPPNKNSP
jgi:tetratricopeptide (TPR) repeat protein